jgi:two-component system phosphate regulon response regulator PhoB
VSRILVAEDDPDILHLVAYKLRRSGFDVIEAPDGRAALRETRDVLPDLIVLDVRMPHLSGLDVLRELREDPRCRDVPVIILTARARPQDLEQAYAAGATDYVIKPFSPRELVVRVEAVLARVGA